MNCMIRGFTQLCMLSAIVVCGPNDALAQSELMGPTITLRAPTVSGGARVDMAPAAPGAIGSLKATIGQSSPLGRLTGFPSLTMAATGFWPVAAVVDCGDAGDFDCDGIPNAVDVCPRFNAQDQTDTDGNGRGDLCECGDQSGDGTVNVDDILAVNAAIFNPALTTPLCDANYDKNCDVNDILAVNAEIFSPGSSSTCRRSPFPSP
jgi:hypothetical protein